MKNIDIIEIYKDIDEREKIIDKFYTYGIFDRDEAISKIQRLRLKDSRVAEVTSMKLARSAIPFDKSTDQDIINELKMQVEVLKTELVR